MFSFSWLHRSEECEVHPGRFENLASPFRSTRGIRKSTLDQVRRALHMDFENYTLGHLVPDRGNYQDDHVGYQAVKKQVMQRMFDLGFTSEKFEEADTRIARNQSFRSSDETGRIDRYGKKYSWIAFFEMYGVRLDAGLLAEHRLLDRTSDCDIDPSFPSDRQILKVEMPKVFWRAPQSHIRWLRHGPSPTHLDLLTPEVVDGQPGPWLLLDGFVRLVGTHNREVWTFLRALLMKESIVSRLQERIDRATYLGNHRIPEAADDFYTFAGEVPWSPRYGAALRRQNGSSKPHREDAVEWRSSGRGPYPVEVPVHHWAWESHHSPLNRVSGVKFPAPALCDFSGLQSRAGSFDLYDPRGQVVSIYRQLDSAESGSHLVYMRKDLVQDYLTATDQRLVWIPWGERTLHHDEFERRLPEDLQTVMAEHANNFSDFLLYP